MDSDFDIDEGDEPDSDHEEDAPRRKSRVVTKAYKVETIRSCRTLNQAFALISEFNLLVYIHENDILVMYEYFW